MGRGVSPRGLPSRFSSGTRQGTSPKSAFLTSWPVSTSSTPGALAAADVSIFLMSAWACGERSTYMRAAGAFNFVSSV